MKSVKPAYRLLAVLLAVLIIVTAIPMGAAAEVQRPNVAVEAIDRVRLVDEEGVAVRIGETVVVEGVITVGTGVVHPSNTILFVQDETAGMGIFAFGIEQELAQGDKVRIRAEIGQWRGLVQLQKPVFEILERNIALPIAKEIELAELRAFETAEVLEGTLVKTRVKISRIPGRPAGGAYNVRITDIDGNNKSTLRVGEGTDIDVGKLNIGEKYTLTGIVGQFDRSSPYHSGYQLFPRSQADLVLEKEAGLPSKDTVFPAQNEVAEIKDGDSVILKTPVIVNGREIIEVRLSGIDAPEAWRREDAYHNQRVHDQRARDHLRNMLPPGTEITLRVCQVKTCAKLGRLLAHIKKGDLNVNKEMLRQGYALTYVVWPNNMEGGRFEALRSALVETRQNKRGIWNPADPLEEIPLKYRQRKFGWAPEKYVGDFDTKTYVKFEDMEKVARENRVFFFSYEDVIASGFASGGEQSGGRNVIFIHPDGANANHFHAARLLRYGPEGKLNWDRLPAVALYKPHVLDNLQAGSVAGAVAHATGVKTNFNYYGMDKDGQPMVTITERARDAGFATGLVNTGCITEPGTGVFVANVESRGERAEIVLQIAESGVDVILGGGERYFLPTGVEGRHGEGGREDGRNLIEEMKEKGYAVVFTRDELTAVDTAEIDKLLGLFAARHTFNDKTEEYLKANNLPHFRENSPTIAEMVTVAIGMLSKNEKGFLLVVEDESIDNFADGANNASGTIKAVKRADDAIGVAINFAETSPKTLVITAADSDAGGMNIWAPSPGRIAGWEGTVPATAGAPGWHASYQNMAAADGVGGTETAPFITACGNYQFGVVWAGQSDFATTTTVRAYGLKSELVRGMIDNTDIYHLMAEALGLEGNESHVKSYPTRKAGYRLSVSYGSLRPGD